MQIERTEKKVYADFDGLLEYAEYANSVPESNFSKYNDEDKWSGGTFEDAVKQARTGNPELVKKLFDDVRILEGLLEEDDKVTIRDVTGDYFDVGEVVSGEPECWRREEYSLQKPVIPIYASFSMHVNIKVETILNRGAAIIALVDALEKQGFIVDLRLDKSCHHNGINYYEAISVAVNPVDLDSAAFIIANPLCLRRLGLASLEKLTDSSNCDSYGTPRNYDATRILKDSDLSGFYFSCSNGAFFDGRNYRSLEAAKNHILDMLEKFRENPAQIIIG